MIYQLCAVYDKKVSAYMPTFQVRSRGEAMRSFMDAVDQDTQGFKRHAEDYVLFLVGEFDDQSGAVYGKLEPIMTALDCLRQES